MLLQATPVTDAAAGGEKPVDWLKQIENIGWDLGQKVLLGLVILIVGLWIAGRLTKLFGKFLKSRDVDETLHPFLKGFIGATLRILVIVIVISTMGVEMTSIIAVLGSVGLAIGLALQGSLANAAGGILLLLLKPFKKGDVIEAQGKQGKVEEINIISTKLHTFDNKVIYIPNGPLAGGPITNFTAEDLRRVDITFGIGYDDDFEQAKSIVQAEIAKLPQVLQEPAPPFVRLIEHGDSSINLVTRVWTHTPDYWDVYFSLMENVKTAFDREGISIPYPQRDVHMHYVNQPPQ